MNFFTSDLHFGHRSIIPYCARPWATVEDMERGLISNWNRVVGCSDTTYVLGDFSFLSSAKTQAILAQLCGKKVLVRGNHDNVKSQEKAVRLGFDGVVDDMFLFIGGQQVWLSHYPYEGDHTEVDRYLDRRLVNRGEWLLHGHVHQGWKFKDKMINVGVDVWDYAPVDEDIIRDIVCRV